MRITTTFSALFALLTILPGPILADHQVTRWRHGHDAAVSVTFDDGLESQVTTGVPMLNERGLKGTFYVLTADEWNEWDGYWDDWRTVAAAGHEIGSHTLTHAQLSTVSETELRKELQDSRDIIEAEIPDQSCLTIAYPYGDYDDHVKEVTAEYYIAGRTVWSPLYLNFYPGDPYDAMDPFAIGSYAFDYPGITTLEALVERLDAAEEYEAWFLPHIHPLTDPLAVSVLAGFLDELLVRDIWVDTVVAVFKYMEERNASTLSVLSETDAQIVLSLTHDLDPTIYDMPLTIRSVVPGGWSLVGVVQGGAYELAEAVLEGSDRVVYFDALPGDASISLVPDLVINTAPAVNAGPDLASTLPAGTLNLNGTAMDDGLPNPPATLSIQWTALSGPGPVDFDDAASAVTAATFAAAGDYVLQLQADDGELVTTDSLTVTIDAQPTGIQVLEIQVTSDTDDAEESIDGAMVLDSSDLELVFDYWNGPGEQTVGLRFRGVDVPPGAAVTNAWLSFTVDEQGTESTALEIRAQATDDAPAFTLLDGDLSTRPTTISHVSWNPAPWTSVGVDHETPDLSPVLQEVLSRPGWAAGGDVVLLISGTGHRTAVACDSAPGAAPLLHLEYTFDPLPNKAPVVVAGADTTASLPTAQVLLSGSVTDDGLPEDPGMVTTQWSAMAGPATVNIATPTSLETLVSFPLAGTYTLRLSVSDGELEASDDVIVEVLEEGTGAFTFDAMVSAGTDDAEEGEDGTVYMDSSDLELVYDDYHDAGNQIVGLRFATVDVPKGAIITAAWLNFTVDETSDDATSLVIFGQDADHAATFASSATNVSSRPITGAQVPWVPAPWTAVGASGPAQQSPDISSLVQEVVLRNGWATGNAMGFIITGTGLRVAMSADGNPDDAARLHVEYALSGEPVNSAPHVNAGPDADLTLPAQTILLAGTVTDDGLPNPPGLVTSLWGVLSGPGPVDFSAPSSTQTQATFSLAGTYVLELAAGDGELTASDTVTIKVLPEGSATVLEVSVASGNDDAEESGAGTMYLDSSDLELVFDYWNGSAEQTVGLRFTGVGIPAGAVITAAWVSFQVDETGSSASSLVIHGQDTNSAPAFSEAAWDLSSRSVTTAQTGWTPSAWTTPGAVHDTPDLAPILQEIVDRPGWSSGNAMALLITGSGARTAESYEGSASGAPLLHIEYSPPSRAKPSPRSPDRG